MSDRRDTRKRSREDESNDFMPLSKRINNLHLTNPGQVNVDPRYGHPQLNHSAGISAGEGSSSSSGMDMNGHLMHLPEEQSNSSTNGMPLMNGHHQQHHPHHPHDPRNTHQQHHHHHQQSTHNHNHHHLPSSSSSSSPTVYNQQILPESYDPELTQSENPHYYQRNKLLYELHFIRSRRCHNENE